jgi:hypothetical protein
MTIAVPLGECQRFGTPEQAFPGKVLCRLLRIGESPVKTRGVDFLAACAIAGIDTY